MKKLNLPKETPELNKMFRKMFYEKKLKNAVELKEDCILFEDDTEEQIEGFNNFDECFI